MTRRTHQADNINRRLGQAIRDRRIRMGMSQQVLGKVIRTSGQQIQKYENGRNSLTIFRLVEIAAALDWSVFMLLTFALGEQPVNRREVSDRATMELVKRFTMLKPNERAGIVLLVRKLAEGSN